MVKNKLMQSLLESHPNTDPSSYDQLINDDTKTAEDILKVFKKYDSTLEYITRMKAASTLAIVNRS